MLDIKGQVRGTNEALQEFELSGGAVRLATHDGADVVDVLGNEVGEAAVLEMAPDVFDGVQLRCVGWEPLGQPAESLDEAHDLGRRVNPCPVEEHDGAATDVTMKVLCESHDLLRADVLLGMQGDEEPDAVTEGRHDQSADGGHLSVRARLDTNLRRVAGAAPGPAQERRQQEAGFVDQNQVRAEATDVFFTAGQVFASQIRTRWSLRSFATFCGRWGERPDRRRSLEMYRGW